MLRLSLFTALLLTFLSMGCGRGLVTRFNNPSPNPGPTGPSPAPTPAPTPAPAPAPPPAPTPTPTPTPAPTPAPGPSTSAPRVIAPKIVTVKANAAIQGVDIITGHPSTSPAMNALDLGRGNTASNVGTAVDRGSSETVLLFGPGLSGDMTITISGPNDITVSNPVTIKSTNSTPGIQFNISVPANAAVGARTVFLQSGNDITAFTGGLEVQ